MVDRTAGSPTWAGTTLGTPAGFATDIPLTLTNSTMSVILWSPQAGVPIRLKVEDSNDPTHTCETEVVTTVANGWDTLVFDFSNEAPGTQPLSIGLGFGWTFNMASIFCDFGNTPSSSTIYYIDDVTFGGVVSGVSGCTDPAADNYDANATTDDGSCTYPPTILTITTTVCDGATSVQMTGPWWGWDPWAGPVAVDNGNGTWTFTFSPAPTGDMEYLLVVDGVQEDLVAAGTASGDWSCTPITDNFSYANRLWVVGSGDVTNVYGTCGACVTGVSGCTDPAADNYDANATTDDGSCTYGPSLSQIDLPVTWDDTTVDYTVTPFGGTTASLSADPINASNTVLMVDRTAGSPTWAGTTLGTPAGFATDIPLTLTNSTMSVILWSPQAGVPIRLKVEDSNDPTHTCETEVVTTVANGWDTLVFDFSNEAPGTQPLSIGLGFGWTFNMASIFCDFGNTPSSSTIYYIDDVTFGGVVSGVSGCTDPAADNYDANATTDDGSCTYPPTILTITTTVCDGATSVQMTGPWWGWDPWAGPVAVDNGNGTWTFTLNPAPTGDMEYLLVVDGVQEDLVAAGTASGDWSCTPITDNFSYANRLWVVGSGDVTNVYGTCGACVTGVSGCTDPAADNYDANATTDDGSCTYGPSLSQIDLPVTWDDTTVDYTVTPFGGTTASLSADPINASNTVLMVDRTAGSPTWAGTTLGTPAGFATDIPLTLTNSTMSVILWSPQAGVPIRLKVEDSNDPTHTCETEVVTTVANGWDTLVFDFSNEAPGTQPLSIGLGFGWTFNMASIFCDFGNTPSSSTIYYIDDVTFGGVVSGVSGCTDPAADNYDANATTDDGSCTYPPTILTITTTVCDGATSVQMTGPWWGWDPWAGPVAVDNGNGTWTFTLNPAPTGDMEYLLVVDGVQEDLVAAGTASGDWSCTPITDYFSYANRLWVVGSGDVTNVYGTCGACVTGVPGCTDPAADNYDANATTDDGSCTYPPTILTITTTVCDGATSVQMTGPWWGWDPWAGPVAVDNGNGTWTFTLNPAPTGDMEYLLVVDGVQEDLVAAGTASGDWSCTPITDNFSYANRLWVVGSGDVTNVYGTCGACVTGVSGCTDPTALNYDANATTDDGSCQPFTYGCTDATASNYNSTVNTDDGSCVYLGCTDATADNYDATATVDDGSCTYNVVDGCTDPTATNYDASATNDDGSCTYSSVCTEDAPTGLFVDGIIHSRAVINWDNMNSSTCTVDQYRIRFRAVGTSSWTQKTMGGPVGTCTYGNQRIDKLLLGLTGNTTYEYEMKAWYCGGGTSSWTGLSTFTTADNCPNVGNLTAVGANPTKATFTWDASNGSYEFVRLKARVDSISNPTGSDWFQIGGAGVAYGTYTKDKNGLTAGETYRGQARAFCDPNGGAYFSLSWTPLVYWTQPTSRIEGGTAIANLDVYPNPSRDLFNVTFTSEDVQDLEVRVINVVGEVVYTENLQQFVGEYTKSIDLESYTKGVYFLEITTNNGVVNKKLILQ